MDVCHRRERRSVEVAQAIRLVTGEEVCERFYNTAALPGELNFGSKDHDSLLKNLANIE